MLASNKEQLASRQHEIKIVTRDQNKVSHSLALMGRTLPKTAMWLRSTADDVDVLCQQDYNDSG